MTMFEPYKLISLGLALILLAPISVVFWIMANHKPSPPSPSETQAELKERLKEVSSAAGNEKDQEGFSTVGVLSVEVVAFSLSTARWLSFYPRNWVGWLGLAAVGMIVFCLTLSLFFPARSRSVEISPKDASPPITRPANQ